MKSKLATGTTRHARYFPKEHKFEYPLTYYGFDLDELALVDKLPLFSVDQFNLRSLYIGDYGNWQKATIREKIVERCRQQQTDFVAGRVMLYTMPKTLGYVFNPVSFYLLYDLNDEFKFLVLEINNTYAERHQYVLGVHQARKVGDRLVWSFPKAFHVSPFWGMDHEYQVTLLDRAGRLRVDINLLKNKQLVFASDIDLKLEPLTASSHLKDCVSSPFRILLTYPRILLQALILYLYRRITVRSKPNPSSPDTVRAEPCTWLDAFCRWFVMRKLRKINKGLLCLTWPDGRVEQIGNSQSGLQANLRVNSYAVFRKVLMTGSIGLGEAYCAGDWDSDDPAQVLSLFLNNYNEVKEQSLNLLKPFRWVELLGHWFKRNNKNNSRNNISAHYDLSNEFFSLFLDERRVYSAAYYPSPSASLEQAQLVKIDRILEKSLLENGQTVLEIGSGWGALAERCAVKYGCQVVSLTLSKEQQELATNFARMRGLDQSITYKLEDYRSVQGRFDRIISIEMLEAVGHEYLGDFFETCNRVLKPDGLLTVQVIAYPDNEYDFYRTRSDWIQKHIFPGSHLPSLGALTSAAAKQGFIVDSVDNFPEHYARTLKDWRQRFDRKEKEILELGFDQNFIRKWRYYLAACEAQFATRWLAVYQIVFTRPNNQLVVQKQSIYQWKEQAA